MSKTNCLEKIPVTLKEPQWCNIAKKHVTQINVPCGKCARCLDRRKMEWSFRMEQEMNISKTAFFVTLTYAPEHIKRSKYGQRTLVPKHLQDYMKRLRINHLRTKDSWEHYYNNLKSTDKVKMYGCGEYGEERKRPHYHLIIFNSSRIAIEKSWDKGHVHCVPANKYTISYCMKYLDKRFGTKQDWRKEPEFNTMSEGIGECYIDKMKNWHTNNLDVLYVSNINGHRIPMPRYYRQKLFTEEQRKFQSLNVENIMRITKETEIRVLGLENWKNETKHIQKEADTRFLKKVKRRVVD